MILVTGASTGLGLATADALAREGHEVILHARRPDRIGDPDLRARMHSVVFADLADEAETTDLARQVNEFGRLDAVIHNAGVLDGSDITAVNVIAPYILMASLIPPRRSIVLSSSLHFSGSTDLGRGLERPGDYSTSKLLVTTLAMAVAARTSISSHAVDPGWVPTRMGGKNAPDDLQEGHRTQVWLATAQEEDIVPATGGYWHHRQARPPHQAVTDEDFQNALIGRLSDVTGLVLPDE